MWYLLRWRKGNITKEKRDSKFTNFDFKLESQKDQQLISEYLRDYMKNGLMKTRSRRI
jgi:type IV secretory pathway VirB4 component